MKEDKESWLGFLRWLKGRGLGGVRLVVSDCCSGLAESLGEVFPEADWQRCTAHFMRNVSSKVPKAKAGLVAGMLKAHFAQEDLPAARAKAVQVEAKLREMGLKTAAEVFAAGVEDTLSFLRYPPKHRRSLHTNNPLERIMKEWERNGHKQPAGLPGGRAKRSQIRRRTRVVGAFPDGKSALMLACARLRHIAGSKWGERRYLDMGHLREMDAAREAEQTGDAA